MKLLHFVSACMLVAGPLTCGLAYFAFAAPRQDPGVYLETHSGVYSLPGYRRRADRVGNVYPLTRYSQARGFAFTDVAMKAAVVPDGDVESFFVVGSKAAPFHLAAPSARVYGFILDEVADQVRSDFILLDTRVRQVDPALYEVTSDQMAWRAGNPVYDRYAEVAARTTDHGAALAAMVGLVIDDPGGSTRRLYPVRIGPQ